MKKTNLLIYNNVVVFRGGDVGNVGNVGLGRGV